MVLGNTHVLLVQDRPADARLLQILHDGFNPNEFEITAVDGMSEAKERIDRERIHVILLDVSLPDNSSLETVSTVRGHAPHIPMVILSGARNETLALHALQEGAQDYIGKEDLVADRLIHVIRYAIERHRLMVELRAMSLRDEHTRAYNKKGFAMVGAPAFQLAERLRSSISVVFVTLNNRRQIDESMGHHVGNYALIETANILRETFRTSDIIGQISGDTFVILLIGSTGREEDELISQLQSKVELRKTAGKWLYPISLSVTAVHYDPQHPRTLEELLDRDLQRTVEGPALPEPTLEERVARSPSFHGIIGDSLLMQEVYRRIGLCALSNVTVLLRGESGTGKELAAAVIRKLGARRDKPFQVVNCSAIPEALLESELFGHVKGAFTGAVKDKIGMFQAAHQGTLLLDEIGDLPPLLQVKLLRALQEMEIRRVGDDSTVKVDVRIIAATNRDLEALLVKGLMREDFYYRIRVFEIILPSFRQRKDDVPFLIYKFLSDFSKKSGKTIRGVTPEAMERLTRYSWPGNIRELKNAMEHAVVVARDEWITATDLPIPRDARSGGHEPSNGWSIQELEERREISEALKQALGNQTRAASILGISRMTLWKKVKHFDIVLSEFRT